jgi:hypothetical protein
MIRAVARSNRTRRNEMADDQKTTAPEGTADASDEDTEGQSLHNYELARALTRERANEAARMARDAARAREARDAKQRR